MLLVSDRLPPDPGVVQNWRAWDRDDVIVALGRGFDPDLAAEAHLRSRRTGLPWLPVSVDGERLAAGPLAADDSSSCGACAESRRRTASASPALERGAATPGGAGHDALGDLWSGLVRDAVAAALGGVQGAGLRDVVLLAGPRLVAREPVARAVDCPLCGPAAPTAASPAALLAEELDRRAETSLPVRRHDPADPDGLRGPSVHDWSDPAARAAVTSSAFGPVLKVRPEGAAPHAMVAAAVAGSTNPGYGRAPDHGTAQMVAVLEAFERSAAVPGAGRVLRGVPFEHIAEIAVDPGRFGRLSAAQLADPGCRVRPWDPSVPVDWTAATQLGGGPVLVPAELGFYGHHTRLQPGAAPSVSAWWESSSGSALGGSREEATLHALIELAERDAFLQAWYRRQPLPRLSETSLPGAGGQEARLLADRVRARGFDLHLLVASSDVQVPVVWALAVQDTFPCSFSAAGAHPDITSAAVSALRELSQLTSLEPDWERDRIQAMVENPWLVDDIDDHVKLYAEPAVLSRLTTLLGGPDVDPDTAHPGWRRRWREESGGTVAGALAHVRDLFANAGMPDVYVVDQSTRDLTDLGLHAVKALVPGVVPVCFGHAHQRLLGLERAAWVIPAGHGPESLDPHPFP
jgi:ribosomal protein S12 methylthiotransferase accessory factor